MKKGVLSLLLAIALVLSLVACAGGADKPSSDEDTGTVKGQAPAEDEPMELPEKEVKEGQTVVKFAGGSRLLEWMIPKAEEYMVDNPDIVIQFDEVLAKDADLYTKITMMMQSPSTSPDLITEDGFMIISDAQAGYLHPLDDYVADWDDFKNFNETILEGSKGIDGVLYGIPYSTDVQGLWYSKVLFEEAGLPVPFEPKNWQDILDAAVKIKELNKEDTIPFYIYASKTQPEQTSMRTFQTLYSGTGGELYDFDTNKWIVDNEKLIDVLTFVDDVYNKLEVGPSLSLSSQNQIGNLLIQEYMPEHRLGMYITGSWEPQNWSETGTRPWPEALDEIGFAKIPTQLGQDPGFTTMSGGWTFAIPENAKEKDAAFDFLKYIVNKENLLDLNLYNSELTTRNDVAEMDEYLSAFSVNREANDMIPFTHFRPSVEHYPSVSLIITDVTESVAIGTATPEEAAEKYKNELITLVGEDMVLVK